MIEPVDPSDMLVSFVAAALIILLGAGYAARSTSSPRVAEEESLARR